MATLTTALPTTQDMASGSFKCTVFGCEHALDEVDNSEETSKIDAWRALLRSLNLGPGLTPASPWPHPGLTLALAPAPALALSPHPSHSSPNHDPNPRP